MNETDSAAMKQSFQAGDKETFRAIVEQNSRVLFGTAYLMTHDRGRAEDAVQEAFIKAWQNLPALHLDGNLRAWLVRIVINEVKQQYRKKRLPEVPIEQAAGVPDPGEIDTSMILDEEHRLLRQAVELLPQKQKEVVVLRYFADLSVPEVAKATGQREGTIKSRLSRALDRLETILNKSELP